MKEKEVDVKVTALPNGNLLWEWWSHKCGKYLKKEGPEVMVVYTPWIFEPISATAAKGKKK